MITIYVETNFLLELAFAQEQAESCEEIICLCEAGKARLVVPVFCIGECFESLVRRAMKRKKLANEIAGELRQLSRSLPYKDEVEASQGITGLLVRSSQEDEIRLNQTLRKILAIAHIIPLEASVVLDAERHRQTYKLGPQDAIIYASVIRHLPSIAEGNSCFLNRNSRDFDDPDIEFSLSSQGCKMLFSFQNGLNYIEHAILL